MEQLPATIEQLTEALDAQKLKIKDMLTEQTVMIYLKKNNTNEIKTSTLNLYKQNTHSGTYPGQYFPYVYTGEVTDFESMFEGCTGLTSVDCLDTSKGESFFGTFSDCTSLTHVGSMDTSNGINFSAMFSGCTRLTDIDSLDTSNCLAASIMFGACASLAEIPPLDTSKCEDFTAMFSGCTSLTTIPDIDTSSVINDSTHGMYSNGLAAMFQGCTSLTTVQNKEYNPNGNIASADSMFKGCTSVATVSNLTVHTHNITSMFHGCTNLTTVNGLTIDLSNPPNGIRLGMSYLFNDCTNLTTISNLNFIYSDTNSAEVYIYRMFANCSSLTSIPDLNFGIGAATSGGYGDEFDGCTSLTTFTDNPYAPEGSRWQFNDSINFGDCPLDKTSILKVFNGLQTVSGKTITISSTTNGYLSATDKAIAEGKGWTVAVQ